MNRIETKTDSTDIWKPNKQNLRIREILLKLKNEKVLTVNDLSSMFGVTKMTIYRDINILQEKKIVTFVNGVVISNDMLYEGDKIERKDITYDLPTEIQRNIEVKKRIAKKAVELIDPEDIIFIDSGSTMEFLSREIPENKDIVVVCHAFYVLINTQMKKGCGIIFPGGHFHEDSLVFESEEGVELLKRIRINKAFFAAGGIDNQLGVTCANPFIFNTKRAVINSSYKKILVADSTKFNMVKKVYYADLKEFDAIVTDDKIPEKYLNICRDLGIDIYLA